MMNQTESRLRVNPGHLGVKYEEENLIYKGIDAIIETSDNTYWCEVLRPDDIVKPMIDLDMQVDSEETMNNDKKKIMKEGRDYVEEIFECDVSDIAISDSCGYDPEKKLWKISFHYVVNGMSVRWGDLKRYDRIKDSPTWLDETIYTKRAMRMIHCSKTGQNRHLRPVTHKKDAEPHIIQWVTPEDCKNRFVVPGLSPSQSDENLPSKDASYTLNEKEAKLLRLCDPDSRQEWTEIGMALKGMGVEYQVWEEWSRDSEKFNQGKCETQWKSYSTKSKYKINTIDYWAKKHYTAKYHEVVESIYTSLWAEGEQQLVEYMNRECVYLEHLGKKSSYMLIDRDSDTCLKDKCGMVDHFEDIGGVLDSKGKPLNVFRDIWCKSKYRRKCSKLDFYPSLDYDGKNFNVFKGFAYPPESAVKGDVQPMLDHIKKIWCKNNEEQYEYTLNWLAHSIQKPWVKIGVALCLNSFLEGVGKGVPIHKTMAIIGTDHSVQVANDEDIFGNFTGAMSGMCMMNLNEAVWGGNKKNRGLLMNMITEPRCRIRFLNHEPFYETSFHNYIIDSNERWFIPAGPMSRRFFALAVDNKYVGPETPESKAYFAPLLDMPVEHWAYYLYNRNIDGFDPRSFPETDLLRQQAQMGMGSIEKWLRTAMIDGEFHDAVMEQSFGFSSWITKETMYRIYKTDMEGGHGRPDSASEFWKRLKSIFCDELEYTEEEWGEWECRTGGKRKRQFKPKLEEIVAIWNKKKGDNVKTVKIQFKEEPKEQEEASPLDDGVDPLDEGVVV